MCGSASERWLRSSIRRFESVLQGEECAAGVEADDVVQAPTLSP